MALLRKIMKKKKKKDKPKSKDDDSLPAPDNAKQENTTRHRQSSIPTVNTIPVSSPEADDVKQESNSVTPVLNAIPDSTTDLAIDDNTTSNLDDAVIGIRNSYGGYQRLMQQYRNANDNNSDSSELTLNLNKYDDYQDRESSPSIMDIDVTEATEDPYPLIIPNPTETNQRTQLHLSIKHLLSQSDKKNEEFMTSCINAISRQLFDGMYDIFNIIVNNANINDL